jgi:hypothetical protein
MNRSTGVDWQRTAHGWTADMGGMWLCINGPHHDNVWSWEVNALKAGDDVRGEAYTESLALLYASACALALAELHAGTQS